MLPILVILVFGLSMVADFCQANLPLVMYCDNDKYDKQIAIFNFSSWLECENGKMELKQCIVFGNPRGIVCVSKENVLKKQATYMESGNKLAVAAARYTYTDFTYRYPDCWFLWNNYATVMHKFQEKEDCLNGYELMNVETENLPCRISNRRVIYVYPDSMYACINGILELKKCVLKFDKDDQYYCIRRSKVIEIFRSKNYITELDKKIAKDGGNGLCDNLAQILPTIYPEFRNDLVHCNAEDDKEDPTFIIKKKGQTQHKTVEEVVDIKPSPVIRNTTAKPPLRTGGPNMTLLSLTVAEKDPYPQFIDCQNSANSQSLVVQNNTFWKECVKGRLETTYCSFHDGSMKSLFGCVDHNITVNKVHSYYTKPESEEAVVDCYMDMNRDVADCHALQRDWGVMMAKFSVKVDCVHNITGDGDESAKDTWCRVSNRKVFTVDGGNGWFTCKDGSLVLQKCVFKQDKKYLCLSKQKIDAVWTNKPEDLANNGTFCETFKTVAGQIYSNYANDLESCEAEEEPLLKLPEYPFDVNSDDYYFLPLNNSGGHEALSYFSYCDDASFKASDGIYYKCRMPYKCRLTNGKCFKFSAMEKMYGSCTSDSWNRTKYENIRDSIIYYDQLQNYKKLESDYVGQTCKPDLFQKLVDIFNDGLFPNQLEALELVIAIQIGGLETLVDGHQACKIVEQFTPFKDAFIEAHTEPCETDSPDIRPTEQPEVPSSAPPQEVIAPEPDPPATSTNFDVVANPGGEEAKQYFDDCNEESFEADDDIYYKCNMPYMCPLSNGQCMKFSAIEEMFTNYRSKWNNTKYLEIRNNQSVITYVPQLESYSDSERYKNARTVKGRADFFKKLVEIHEMRLWDWEINALDKIVNVKVGRTAITVDSSQACYVVENLTPFYNKFIESHMQACKTENEEELVDDESDSSDSAEDEFEIPFDVIPYVGGAKGMYDIKKCEEDEVQIGRVFFKCRMPYMCVTNNEKCLKFNSVEKMFRLYTRFGRYGAWDDQKYNSILRKLDPEAQAVYRQVAMVNRKREKKFYIFQTLAKIYNNKEEKTVTSNIGAAITKVSPVDVCDIVTDLAPFQDVYIKKHFMTCPEME